jgi:predicted DNA-binding ribbon-helix-helix protein
VYNFEETENLEKIRALMRIGEHGQALSFLVQEFERFPENLYILSYLASCHYMMGNYIEFKNWTLKLLHRFQTIPKNNSSVQMQKIALSLVRLLEEIGEIGLAIRLIDDIKPVLDINSDITNSKIIAQKLRLMATFTSSTDLNEIYDYCATESLKKNEAYIDFECALLLSDWTLFGPVQARARLDRFLLSNTGHSAHRRFLIFDFIYESLRQDRTDLVLEDLLTEFAYLQVDPFEKLVWDLMLIAQKKEPHQELSLNRLEELSQMGALRISHLMLRRAEGVDLKLELSKKLGSLLNQLSLQSKLILSEYFPMTSDRTIITVTDHSLSINGQPIPITRCKSVHRFLSYVADRSLESTDQLIKKMFNSDFDDSSFSKLRVTVARVNSLVLKSSGFMKAILINKNQVKVSRQIVICKGA